MRRLLALAVLVAPLAAHAIPWSMLGGEPLTAGRTVAQVGFGFPSLRAGYAQGFSQTYELGARGAFDYLRGAGEVALTSRYFIGPVAGGQLALRGQAGLYADAGFRYFEKKNPNDAGLLLAPGAVITWPYREVATFGATLDVPLAITFGRGGGTLVPVLLGGVFDMALAEKVNVGATVQFGPRYDAPGQQIPRTTFWFEGQLWTSIALF